MAKTTLRRSALISQQAWEVGEEKYLDNVESITKREYPDNVESIRKREYPVITGMNVV